MAKIITTQRVGNFLGFMGLVALPLLIGFAIWQSRRR